MKAYSKILRLIEGSDKSDVAKMAEINAACTAYFTQGNYKWDKRGFWLVDTVSNGIPTYYTHGLDATRRQLPENWAVDITIFSGHQDSICVGYRMVDGDSVRDVNSVNHKPIELALLYVVVQAIAIERGELK